MLTATLIIIRTADHGHLSEISRHEAIRPHCSVDQSCVRRDDPPDGQFIFPGKTFNGPDWSITLKSWQQYAEDGFRFYIRDRLLGRAVWEHYLGFEELRTSFKAIKLLVIYLRNVDEVIIQLRFSCAILKITNRHNDRQSLMEEPRLG